MGSALYLVFDGERPGFDPSVCGKALARCADELDAVAEGAGVPSLFDFFAVSDDMLAELGDALVEPVEGIAPRTWFEPAEVLPTVAALRRALTERGGAVSEPEAVLADLAAYDSVLQRASGLGLRCHVTVDC